MSGMVNKDGELIELKPNTIQSLGVDISAALKVCYADLCDRSGTFEGDLHYSVEQTGGASSFICQLVHEMSTYVRDLLAVPACWFNHKNKMNNVQGWHLDAEEYHGMVIAAWPHPTQLYLSNADERANPVWESGNTKDMNAFGNERIRTGQASALFPEPGILYLVGGDVPHRTNFAAIGKPHLVTRLWLCKEEEPMSKSYREYMWQAYPKPWKEVNFEQLAAQLDSSGDDRKDRSDDREAAGDDRDSKERARPVSDFNACWDLLPGN